MSPDFVILNNVIPGFDPGSRPSVIAGLTRHAELVSASNSRHAGPDPASHSTPSFRARPVILNLIQDPVIPGLTRNPIESFIPQFLNY